MADINIENLTVNTRSLNGGRLTHQQLDDNFNNLLAAVQQVAGQGGGAAPATSPWIPAPSITTDDIGKIAMLDLADAQVKVYAYAPAEAGTAGIYEITVNNPHPVNIEFHIYDLSISPEWLPSPYPATTDEAATLLRDYLNNNHSGVLTASGKDSNVTVTFLNPPKGSGYNGHAWVSNGDYSVATIQEAQRARPARPYSPALGVIKELDGNSNVRLDNSAFITAVAGEEVSLIPDVEGFGLLAVALSGGAVGPITSLGDIGDSVMPAVLGWMLNAAGVGDEIVISKIQMFGVR